MAIDDSDAILPIQALAELLRSEGHCESLEEANGIAEIIAEDGPQSTDPVLTWLEANTFPEQEVVQALQDCLDLSLPQCERFVIRLKAVMGVPENDDADEDEDESDGTGDHDDIGEDNDDENYGDDMGDDDGELLDDGECEMCERYIRLTRHHLIPRQTWPRVMPRLLRAAEVLEGCRCMEDGEDVPAREQQQWQRAEEEILGDGLAHWARILVQQQQHGQESPGRRKRRQRGRSNNDNAADEDVGNGVVSIKKSLLRTMLQHHTIDICRPCHSQIHRTHDNMTLAMEYSTMEALLSDDSIRKFCKWANKQKVGKYGVK
uniref:Uncharacterized protein n=1 Tax=Craspedostauros australis TaxID=1486917 RepID=A0A7R9ZKQ2_9STRA|mmetsp:Transcript_14056/g.38621  ORF Transcript_14056/g.38621 Transcript_14056/m.38621 type:complete len:319 (+) Transcript_14056:137-1093(+)